MFCLLRCFKQKDLLDRRTERHIIFAAACAQSTPPSLGEGPWMGPYHSISPIPLALRYSLQREN